MVDMTEAEKNAVMTCLRVMGELYEEMGPDMSRWTKEQALTFVEAIVTQYQKAMIDP